MDHDDDIRFCIIMATFCRGSGKTPVYLKRALESISNQTNNNWDLILVGDKYEPETEVLGIIETFRNSRQNNNNNKIIYLKNDKTERDHIKNKLDLWHCAGATAMNLGLKYARENKYKYYCHLDDDDFWLPNHLSELREVYATFKNCVFAYTQSTHITGVLPHNNEVNGIYPNNRMPLSCNTIHSSFSFRIDIIPFNYFTQFEPIEPYQCSDAKMLDEIKQFIMDNNYYCSIYIPKLTCHHDVESEEWK